MNETLRKVLIHRLLAYGDDELILGHRDSEWCGHAPIIEEDIAFANLALDEIGHAAQWYAIVSELEGQDLINYPEKLVFFRSEEEYHCAQIVELLTGDWAFSMLRQYLFDAYEYVLLDALKKSAFEPVAGVAEKISKEEIYHLRHTEAWVRRLGLGTEESHRRMQAALEALWPYTQQLFAPTPQEDLLVQAGYVPDLSALRSKWEEKVLPVLQECELKIPDEAQRIPESRRKHTPHLEVLLSDMQSLTRMDPDAEW